MAVGVEDVFLVLPVGVVVEGGVEFVVGLDEEFPGAVLALVVDQGHVFGEGRGSELDVVVGDEEFVSGAFDGV